MAVLGVVLGVAVGFVGPAGAGDDDGGAGQGAGEDVRVESEEPVTAMDRRVRPGNNSPQVVIDPDDDDFVVVANRLDAPGFGCALHVSGDGGAGWVPVDPVPELPDGAHSCYGPDAAFGPDGTLHVTFVGLAGQGNQPMGVFLTSSTDRGRTFSPPRQVGDELRFGVRLAVDRAHGTQGRLHLVWVEARSDVTVGSFGPPPNPVMAAHSDDSGQSWSAPVQVSDRDRDRVVGPAVAVGPDGAVHVAYYDLLDDARDYQGLEGPVWEGTWELMLASSGDGGASFDAQAAVDAVTPHERVLVVFTMPPPALAVDAAGRVCTAWTDARGGSADVLASCRARGEAAFGEAVRVNDDPADHARTQELPALAFSPGGRLDVVFTDRRHSEDDDHRHVFASHSTDGGASFAPNVRVTSTPSFTEIGQRYDIASAAGRYETGGRLGLASTAAGVIAAWTDTRNSRPLTHAQDIFAARITGLPGDPGGSPVGTAGLLAGLGLLVAVAAGLGLWRRRRTTPAVSQPADGGSP